MHLCLIAPVQAAFPTPRLGNIYLMFILEALAMGLAPEVAQPGIAFSTVQGGQFCRFDDPARLAQQYSSVNGSSDSVQHAPFRRTEITGHVTALLLLAMDCEGADFLIEGGEVIVEVFAGFGIGQCVRTERLGVVS